VAFDLYELGDCCALAKQLDTRHNDVEVFDIFRVWPEVLLSPSSEDHQEDQTVDEDQEGRVIWDNADHFMYGGRLGSERRERPTYWKGQVEVGNRVSTYGDSRAHLLPGANHAAIHGGHHSSPGFSL
jgi:hypothetical protein